MKNFEIINLRNCKSAGKVILHFALTLLRRLFLLATRHSANKFALCSRSAASVLNFAFCILNFAF